MDLSIIIPAFNRLELLRYTLESVRRAGKGLAVEILVVDDGSDELIEGRLPEFADLPITFLRQPNSGSIVARMNGLRQARGEFVQFLDSDDLVQEDKFTTQLATLRSSGADVCYCDMADVDLNGPYDSLTPRPHAPLPLTDLAGEFYLKVQPNPHLPLYRRAYLQQHLNEPLIPAQRRYDPVGDVWLYYNLAIHPARIVKVSGAYALYGHHDADNYSLHWESLGVAALALMEEFARRCPVAPATLEARVLVGECAFNSWRMLPRQFNAGYERRTLDIWRALPKGPAAHLGGRKFQMLARFIGVKPAAQLFRYLQRPHYSKIRTMSDEEMSRVLVNSDA